MFNDGRNRTPGMECPRCGGFITTSIFQLINNSALICPHCGLRLTINKRESAEAIRELRKVYEAQKIVEKKSKFG